MLAIGSLVAGFSITPVLACHCVSPPGIQGPSSAVLVSGQSTMLNYTFSYADFPSGTNTVTIHITSPPSGWSWTITKSTFTVNGGSGVIKFTVVVTPPSSAGANAQFTLTETSSASGFSPCPPFVVKLSTTSQSTGVPEFPLPMALVGALGFALVMMQRKLAGARLNN
ncbi:MAG: hypothetical protein JRN68_05945 [Nitrososphaerota archaeon]|jgi:hypothetical protein|nr:hypothetical protein [Nitrososphaerota archaeon]